MAMLRRNVANQYLFFLLVDSTGAAVTGATVTARRGIDNAAQAACTGTVTDLGNGQYRMNLSQADTDGNNIGYLFTAPGALPVHVACVLTAADPTDAAGFGLSRLDAAITTRSTYSGADTAGTTDLLARLTLGRAANLDNLNIDLAAFSTSNQAEHDATQAAIATIPIAPADSSGVTTLLSRLTSTRAGNLDFLDAAITTRSTYAGADTPGTTTLLSRVDVNVSTRSIYSGADTAGTTTLLSRLTAPRASALDNLDAPISSRSTYSGADTPGTTTLLSRLTAPRAANLDNLDVAVSTRASGTVSLDAAGREAIADAVLLRSLATGANGGRTVRDALRFLRNRWGVAAGTLTVYAEDDATAAWTAPVTASPGADPITGIDPA